MPFPSHFPMFVSKYMFIRYLENYVAQFNINLLFSWVVKSASHDGGEKWKVEARNAGSGEMEAFEGRFLVVAMGQGRACRDSNRCMPQSAFYTKHSSEERRLHCLSLEEEVV
ncbi:hypothetical protein Vadar_002981 [Vaccinium darrowii]|uniref:Uncharacterized protein n=1 Tax=Vaccinium darrowii TaxID=229202 RepID=A0ACB7XWD2_9ERIC|nr:hypothetical protein Vadar_002981 [Vaccinium darrowii]